MVWVYDALFSTAIVGWCHEQALWAGLDEFSLLNWLQRPKES